MWWNVENLFDVEDDPLTNDEEFTPEGSHHWTPGRYWHKLDNIARTLAAVADEGGGWPDLVGLGEVENDTVMRDLCQRSPLRTAGYEYMITHGPDARGVNVALMYHPDAFRPTVSYGIRIPSTEHGLRATRDMLYTCGMVPWAKDTLHVLLVHFPSRAGANKQATENRRLAAQTLHQAVDSVLKAPGAMDRMLLVMGDFNAEPGDEIFPLLMPGLVSLMPQKKRELRKAIGTYCYQGQWGFLDHILVSKPLLKRVSRQAKVARFPFLLNEKGEPWRTYRGPAYMGGYSDHLPVMTSPSPPMEE